MTVIAGIYTLPAIYLCRSTSNDNQKDTKRRSLY